MECEISEWLVPNNASRWQMGLNSAFEGLNRYGRIMLEIHTFILTCFKKEIHYKTLTFIVLISCLARWQRNDAYVFA
jgi:hypothetical protein